MHSLRSNRGTLVISEDATDQSFTPGTCRICLNEGEIPIFGEDDKSKDVMEFGSIEITYDDDLPEHLCDSCFSLLESAKLFRRTAKKSDEILKSMYFPEVVEDQDSIPENTHDTDNETYIKREYLEYKCSSDSESESKYSFNNENLSNVIKSENHDTSQSIDNKEIEMQLLDIKSEENTDVDNELVMIIVSDKDKTNKITYSCLKCDITFKNLIELQEHESKHHPTLPLYHKKCEICNELVHKSNYKIHIKQHREKYKQKHDKKYGKVECEVCSKKVTKQYYKYHMKMHGTAEEQADRFVNCTLCNKSFSAHYFSEHMKRVHDKTFNAKNTPQNADEKSQIKVLIKCPICDKNIKENVYKEHLARHGGPTRRYICDKCGKEFKHHSAFKTHILIHGSELKYQCQFCPYRGLHLGLLKIHVRTHTGDYNYKCTECPARFITKSNLSKHYVRHRGVCKFKCDMCDKGFYTKRDVDKHIKTVHLDLKNNICNICGKGFGHRDNMLSHQLKVHKRDKITDRRGRMPSYLKEENRKSN